MVLSQRCAMSFQPEQNSVYYIRNQNSQKVIGVEGSNNNTQQGRKLIQYTSGAPDQHWIVFTLDGGLYALANRKSGYVANVEGASTKDGARVIQYTYQNAANEKWSFTSNGDAYLIVSHQSGKVMAVKNASMDNGADIIMWGGVTPNHRWTFQSFSTFSLPPAPTVGTLPDIPRFTDSGQSLPDTTNLVVTAYTYFPCIMVEDSWGVALKMNETPYYLLKKQEYWEKVFQQDIAAHDTIEREEISGMRTTEQQTMERTVGITVARDAGFSFKGVSSSISRQVTQQLKVTQSVTTEVMQQYTTKYTYTNPTATNTSYAKYQRVVEYLLSRTNGTQISSVWTVKKENDTRITTWPANAPVTERQLSTRSLSDDELFQISPNIDADKP
jgi:ricin-type beta-trefoil lectin protein/insecticidal crystal toxin P42 protein